MRVRMRKRERERRREGEKERRREGEKERRREGERERERERERYPGGRIEEIDDLLVVEFEKLGLNAELRRRLTAIERFLAQQLHSAEEMVNRTRQDANSVTQQR